MPNAPQQTLERSFCGGRGHYHKPQSPTRPATIPQGYNDDGSPAWIGEPGRDLPSVAMPNCVQCAVQAGVCVQQVRGLVGLEPVRVLGPIGR